MDISELVTSHYQTLHTNLTYFQEMDKNKS